MSQENVDRGRLNRGTTHTRVATDAGPGPDAPQAPPDAPQAPPEAGTDASGVTDDGGLDATG